MNENIFLQASAGAAIIIAIIVAVIISSLFFIIQRKQISSIKSQLSQDPKIKYDVDRIQTDLNNVSTNLNNLKTNIPHTNEINSMQENVSKLCNDFNQLKDALDEQMNKFQLNTTEDLNKTKDQMVKNAKEEITEFASNHLKENSISREEFDNIKKRLDKLVGADESTERFNILSTLFDSLQIKVINWQCGLFKLLKGGLAPEAEEDHMISKGIPIGPAKTFLKKLSEYGIVEPKKVSAYYLNPDFEWVYSYIENPDWLQKRLEDKIKKEVDYQKFVKNNLNLVEDGLVLIEAEYKLSTGNIDFLCMDVSGKTVGLELKYPVASTTVKRQLAGYKTDYEQKTGKTDSRFILIAPKIPENLKELLKNDGLEYREIDFG